jgi:hypothetical protein
MAPSSQELEPPAKPGAVQYVVENGRNVSKAMRDAGYSPNTACCRKADQSDAWRELMDRVLPDELLAEKHAAPLNKKEVIDPVM